MRYGHTIIRMQITIYKTKMLLFNDILFSLEITTFLMHMSIIQLDRKVQAEQYDLSGKIAAQ